MSVLSTPHDQPCRKGQAPRLECLFFVAFCIHIFVRNIFAGNFILIVIIYIAHIYGDVEWNCAVVSLFVGTFCLLFNILHLQFTPFHTQKLSLPLTPIMNQDKPTDPVNPNVPAKDCSSPLTVRSEELQQLLSDIDGVRKAFEQFSTVSSRATHSYDQISRSRHWFYDDGDAAVTRCAGNIAAEAIRTFIPLFI